MNEAALLDKLLYIYNNATFNVDLEKKKVSFLMRGKKILGQDLEYEAFAKLFFSSFKISLEAVPKLINFLENLDPSDQPFDLPVDYLTDIGTSIGLTYRGYRYTEKEILFVVWLNDDSHNGDLDPLTRSYSKSFIIEKIKEAIDDKQPFSMMIVDIDNFKSFNDAYGHMFGDIVLVEAVAAISNAIGNKGYIARIGGDEFLVIYYADNDYDLVHSICKKVRDSISELSENNVKQADITATMGCSSYPKDGKDYDTLFKKADKALFRGKNKGRNCFIIYNETKCGPIDSDDGHERTMDRIIANTTNYNIIAGVLEIFNRDFSLTKNINEALALIGRYFLLDRIILSNQNPDTGENIREIVWYQPRANKYPTIIPTQEEKQIWKSMLDKTGILKLGQVHANKNLAIYPILKRDNTSAVVAIELSGDNMVFGLVRFEMCSINRFWQQQDVASLLLISKIFSIKLEREYRDNIHLMELYFDKLTHIYNYTKWRNETNEYIMYNPQKTYSVLDFNITGFRNLNEVLGTKTCDEILILIANRLKDYSNTGVIFGRETDDKFLVFFPHQDKDKIEGLLDDVSEYVGNNNHTKTQIILNAGCYLASANENITLSIDKANIARKNNKNAKVNYYSLELAEIEKEKLIMELHMHEAKENGEFLLYLQPKFDTNSNTIVGAEALTRWNYNFEKILTPNYFIPLFEENGFITELDYQVFENVCKFQRKLIDEGNSPVIISVNVSRYQSDFNQYIKTIESIRQKYNISPSLIEIEITEGMYNDNLVSISQFMDDLHKKGYSVSMDDFGAGYSNLANLANLNFDIIKLDKSFCNNIDNKKETIVLSFVMKLAKELNIKVLCEGVETQEYSDYLKSIGCTLIQGFLYDRPMPSVDFEKKYFEKKL